MGAGDQEDRLAVGCSSSSKEVRGGCKAVCRKSNKNKSKGVIFSFLMIVSFLRP